MQWDAGNINILHARSVRKTRTETTQRIAVPHGIPWISGKRQPPSDMQYIYTVYWYIEILIYWLYELKSFLVHIRMSFNTANKPWFWPFSKRCLSGCHFYNEVLMLCCSHLSIGWLQHPEWLRVHFVLKKYRGSSPICLIPFWGGMLRVCVPMCPSFPFWVPVVGECDT